MSKLYNPDGSLTDEGAFVVHEVRTTLSRLYKSLERFPVSEIMCMIVEETTDHSMLQVAKMNWTLYKEKLKAQKGK